MWALWFAISVVCPQAGAFITSNSWGLEALNYEDPLCEVIDGFAWRNPDMLHIFSAGAYLLRWPD
jgi:hypothetical protein